MKNIVTCCYCGQQIEIEGNKIYQEYKQHYGYSSTPDFPHLTYTLYIDKCPKCNKDHAYVSYYKPDYPKI